MDAYKSCPAYKTHSFTIRLIEQHDSDSLFCCYNSKSAVALMNDDNCDFGFFVETPEAMRRTVGYWLDFYRQRAFIRFAIVVNATGTVIGTIEGFGGTDGVLRVDVSSDFEKSCYLTEIFEFAPKSFRDLFGNDRLYFKAIPAAVQRRAALTQCGWQFVGDYRGFHDYYSIRTE